jgi:hypothetical protein
MPLEYDGDDRRAPQHWTLKKEVNLSVMGAIIVQCVLFGIAWGNIQNRVSNLEEKARTLDTVPEKLARIDEKLTGLVSRLDRDERR